MLTSYELRGRARITLENGIFAKTWIYALLVTLIISTIYGFASYTGVLTLIVTGPLYLGNASYYIGITRKTRRCDDVAAAFDGFKKDFSGNLVLGLLVTLYTLLWSLLFIIPGIVKSYSYAMSYYIKNDHPEYSATEVIDASRELMDGHKMRLFCLHLSFIGWILVAMLTCGIGILWVAPYMEAAQAAFYDDLCRIKGGRFTPPTPVYPNQPYGNPYQSYGNPNQPYGNPNQPYGNPNQPYGNPNQPYGNPNQPYGNPNQPYGNPNQPYGNPYQPYGNPNQPYGNPNQPYGNPNQPYGNPNQPYDNSSQPPQDQNNQNPPNADQ